MCQMLECKMICLYEVDDEGNKIIIHYDENWKPLWVELTKGDITLGSFYPK